MVENQKHREDFSITQSHGGRGTGAGEPAYRLVLNLLGLDLRFFSLRWYESDRHSIENVL